MSAMATTSRSSRSWSRRKTFLPKTRERCLALGAVCYLRKPIEGDVLLDSIEGAVRARREAAFRETKADR
jgi:CheY-like chemotaxis protein